MIRKFFALVLVFVFIPIFMFTLFAQAALVSLLNPNLYKESLEKTNAYERILKQALPEVIDQFPDEGESILSLMDKKEAESLLVGTIKPAELRKLTESTTDLLVAYLNYDYESVQLKYDLRQYKNNFVSGFRSIIVKKLSSLPTCTSKQLQSLGSSQEQTPNCKPKGQTGESLYKQFGLDKEITQGLKAFPDEIVITNSSILVKPKGSLDIDPNKSPISGLAGARENIANISKIRTFAAATLAIVALLILLL